MLKILFNNPIFVWSFVFLVEGSFLPVYFLSKEKKNHLISFFIFIIRRAKCQSSRESSAFKVDTFDPVSLSLLNGTTENKLKKGGLIAAMVF